MAPSTLYLYLFTLLNSIILPVGCYSLNPYNIPDDQNQY